MESREPLVTVAVATPDSVYRSQPNKADRCMDEFTVIGGNLRRTQPNPNRTVDL